MVMLFQIPAYSRLPTLVLTVLVAFLPKLVLATDSQETIQLLSVQKIWDAAPHNAFTDLIQHGETLYCVFREGQGHVSPDGILRVIQSTNGVNWTSAARIELSGTDLRDGKISQTPQGKLMILGAAAFPPSSELRHQTYAWVSDNGIDWSEARPIGDPNVWLWRVTWHQEVAYGIGYGTTQDRFGRWYRSFDGQNFEVFQDRIDVEGYVNEHDLVFQPDGTLICLLRRDDNPGTAMMGKANPPYEKWTWTDTGTRVGGPALLQLPDHRIMAGVRLYDGNVRTSLAWLDVESGELTEFLKLPSSGDSSYPGLVWNNANRELIVSYYSSHEGKTSIYLARVRIP
jgi:hypothetical protein